MNTPISPKHDGSSPKLPEESAIPSNINRRSFLMRKAVIGAAAVMTVLDEFYKVGSGPAGLAQGVIAGSDSAITG